jgi:hypothetical protein
MLLCAAACVLCLSAGCVRPYRCTSDLEQDAFNRATRNIYPEDVRVTPGGYLDRFMVAWPGIVVESTHNVRGDEVEVELLIQHHHFDWLEDFKLGDNVFVLSPRGEGEFRTVWYMRMDWGLDEVKRWTKPGNMAVVYGTPKSIENGVIDVEAYCVRLIPRRLVRFCETPYGRDAGWQY